MELMWEDMCGSTYSFYGIFLIWRGEFSFGPNRCISWEGVTGTNIDVYHGKVSPVRISIKEDFTNLDFITLNSKYFELAERMQLIIFSSYYTRDYTELQTTFPVFFNGKSVGMYSNHIVLKVYPIFPSTLFTWPQLANICVA
jgi:hypothetical protein